MNEIRKIVTRLLLLVVISLVFGSATHLFDPLVFHTSSEQSNSTGNAATTGALPPPPVTSTGVPENTTTTGGSTASNTENIPNQLYCEACKNEATGCSPVYNCPK